jgi:hypothetical protein
MEVLSKMSFKKLKSNFIVMNINVSDEDLLCHCWNRGGCV